MKSLSIHTDFHGRPVAGSNRINPEGANGTKLAGLPRGRPKITTATKEEIDNITTMSIIA